MGAKDPRVDAYIAKSAHSPRPILEHLRAVVHAACPDVEETLKWSFPHFMYHDRIVCNMAAFKQHCAFGFWKGGRVLGDAAPATREAMGQFGRIAAIADLPSRSVLSRYVNTAVRLIDDGARSPAPSRPARKRVEAVPPEDLVTALRKNRAARATFESLPPSHRRDYIEWITEAKREETRQRRLATAVEWLAEGKSRNWKYERS